MPLCEWWVKTLIYGVHHQKRLLRYQFYLIAKCYENIVEVNHYEDEYVKFV